MATNVESSVTCELCGSVFTGTRRQHYCDHCNKFFYVCDRCKAKGAFCRFCGIPLKKRGEPVKN